MGFDLAAEHAQLDLVFAIELPGEPLAGEHDLVMHALDQADAAALGASNISA